MIVSTFAAGPCDGGTGVMAGPAGQFGWRNTNGVGVNKICRWKIEVDKHKVGMCYLNNTGVPVNFLLTCMLTVHQFTYMFDLSRCVSAECGSFYIFCCCL